MQFDSVLILCMLVSTVCGNQHLGEVLHGEESMGPLPGDCTVTAPPGVETTAHRSPLLPANCVFDGEGGCTCHGGDIQQILSKMPRNITSLNLIGQVSKTISADAFCAFTHLQRLRINNGELEGLDPTAFTGLGDLELLELNGNKLSFNNESLPSGVFLPLQLALRSLSIMGNVARNGARPTEYPGWAVTPLVQLRNLSITGVENATFDKNFAHLKNIEFINLSDLLRKSKNYHCNIGFVQENTFEHFQYTNLQYLSLRGCKLVGIHKKAFVPLHRLRALDLSCNPGLGLHRAAQSFHGLRDKPIKVLILNNVLSATAHATAEHLDRAVVEDLKSTNLTSLSLDFNLLSEIQPVFNAYLPQLEFLSLRHGKEPSCCDATVVDLLVHPKIKASLCYHSPLAYA